MAKKLDRGIALVFVVLIIGLLAGSLSAAAIGDEMVVNEEVPSIGFPLANFPSDTIPPAAVDDLPSYTTPSTVIEHTPTGENVPVTTKITMTFSEQMDIKSAEGAFSIDPDVSGKFYWDDNTMTFAPASNLNYDTGYFVRLEGANALAGSSLSWHEWKFITEPPNNPPNTPRLSGPTSGYKGTPYSYSTSAEDPDGNGIKYTFD